MTNCPRCFVVKYSLYVGKSNKTSSFFALVTMEKFSFDMDVSLFSVKRMLIPFPLKQFSTRMS